MEQGAACRVTAKAGGRRLVYAVKLHDELAQRLQSSGAPRLRIELDPAEPANNALLVDEARLPLTRAAETQPVDVGLYTRGTVGGTALLTLIGSVDEKLAVRQELAQSKMAQIRQQTEEAERARQSRRTLTLDSQPTGLAVARRTSASRTTIPRPISSAAARSGSGLAGSVASRPLRGGSARPLSEQDSQQSWSPILSDHATGPQPISLDALLNRSKAGELKSAERKPPSRHLLPPRVADSTAGAFHQLEEEFSRRYAEYLALDQWVKDRLAVFVQLQEEIVSAAHVSEQAMFRLVVEEQRLKDDREYHGKLEGLEECCATLVMIKARLTALVRC